MHWWVRDLSCKPNIYVSWSTSEPRERLAHRETGSSPLVKYITDHSKAMLHLWIIYVISVLFLLCIHAHLFIDVLGSPDGKGLTTWLWFVISCEGVTFPLVSWVRCGPWLYRFLIFALFLPWISSTDHQWQVLELRIVEMIYSIKTCIGIHSISPTSSDRYWSSG